MGGGAPIEADNLITDDMIDAFVARYPDAVAGVSVSQSMGSGQAKDGRKYANVTISGVNEDYLSANNVNLLRGRDITSTDLDGDRSVAIVSDKLVGNLFGGDATAALGREAVVYVGSEIYSFTIVGVYEHEQSAMGYSTASDEDVRTGLYIPVTTAKQLSSADPGYSSLTVTASASVDSASFAKQAAKFFGRYYANNEDYRVSALSMETMLESVNSIMGTVNVALAVIAGISLVVGGIGVMNIMLVSVTERTREIGTRKALGATNGNIRVQFIVESTIVCLIGGIIGMALGSLLGYFGSNLIGAPAYPSLGSIALAVGFSMGIGIFFGYYPANKAAKLDPIEALRYE
jgi:putative ABC transport system permease protein